MSDQDTPPPMDDDSSKEDAPPPIEAAGEKGTAEKAAEGAGKAAASIADSLPTEAPSTAGIGLSQGTLGESDERTMSLLAHILGGVTCVVGPLIIWLLKKEESPFVDDQGKEATNFQITVLIAYGVAMILSFIPVIQCIAALLFPAVSVASLIFAILGGIEANKGIVYRYPFALRLIS
ncbi:DUF4870 domain-containing protein [Verrucomicrobiales bacterium BCK34]|nr:DUF4870 domain-containing protein [Verrucomicrobiales bacterium BCK34]